ncbi:PEP-CTERM sorting domain-containing protein [Acidiphilium sp. PA]|uniref:glycine-rich protein n=1 Tax=Acidiphilium sp. PA TaxID=2871705 RepID=UPI0022441F79|nr:PEP-CTERM sorting domain-containing protein [Acidiphilium sp. PA]MCW8308486.1 PEP-CTERM sorting domain-containing protein [Acidiphilium sp. PA]
MTRIRIALLATTLFCATTAHAVADPILLIVAGGGGGAGYSSDGGSGQSGTTAQAGLQGGAAAGVNELGGGGGSNNGGGGGAGALGNGLDGRTYSGSGGLAYPSFGAAGDYGGGAGAYGGGGGGGYNGGGGGGGYNGGGGGFGGGGGGSSYLAAAFTSISETSSNNTGPGSISIEFGNSIQSFSYTTGGPQSYVVANTGVYTITASGGQGGASTSNNYGGGLGATVSGSILLTAGTTLDLEVGGMGGSSTDGGGGGGGSWVFDMSAPTPVPEPGSLAVFGTGLIGLGLVVRKRRRMG